MGTGVELCTVMIKDWHALAAFAFIVQIGFLNKIMSNAETPCFTVPMPTTIFLICFSLIGLAVFERKMTKG